MNLTKRIISSALVLSMATLTIPVEAYATSNTISRFSLQTLMKCMMMKLLVFQITTIRRYIRILMAHTNLTAHQIIALLRWI